MNAENLTRKPWIENPFALISWWDMEKFSAAQFYQMGRVLEVTTEFLKKWPEDHPGDVVGADLAAGVTRELNAALVAADAIGLKITAGWIRDTIGVTKEGADFCVVKEHVWAVTKTIRKEMEGQLFFHVPSTRAAYFGKDAAAFLGDMCRNRFPSVLADIDEAMKCYAVGRYTACAFHLMRATEAGTKALGDAIGAKMRNNNWGDVFKEYDKQLATPPASRPAHWATHGEFLGNIGADLRAVKTLRNGVAHLDESYTEERTEKLLVMIPEFLRKMAEKIDENGNLL